ncbi:MAG: prolyl oligopeptidase family serine peptidase [Acidobacteriota bacterium]
MKFRSLFILILTIFVSPVFSDGAKKPVEEKINSWLQLGPAPVTLLENRVYPDKRSRADHNYLDYSSVIPKEGKIVRWQSDKTFTWKATKTSLFNPSVDSIYYFATYPDAYKRMKAQLILRGISDSFIDVYFDGSKAKKNFNKKEGIVRTELDILNAKHIILLKVLVPAGKEFRLDASISDGDVVREGILRFSTDLKRRVNFRNILNMTGVSGARLSPDGKKAFLSLRNTGRDGKSERWNEILDVSSGRIIYTTRGSGTLSGVKWLKDSNTISYTKTKKKLTAIYIMNIRTGERDLVAMNIQNFSDYDWSSDNTFLIYTKYFRKDAGNGFKYVSRIPERSASPVYKNSIHLFYPQGRITHMIGTKDDDFSGFEISPDSSRVILVKNISDPKNRPYYKSIIYMFDVNAMSLNKLMESNHVSPAMWSPDSRKILMTGGPSAFRGAGLALKKGVIPNDYDTQVYIFDPLTGKVDPVTKEFDPSVKNAFWADMNTMYMSVTEGSYENIYKYKISSKRFTKLSTPVDVTGRSWFSKSGKTALFWGSGSAIPHKLYKVDLRSGRTSLLKDYNRDDFKDVVFGKVENWDYKYENGKTISGRIYYPSDFDKNGKYPCIVYYYGGTSPVERSFGGRYPFNWYAANGFIVYVLQPSGTVGYGQEFSAVHVNDWGKTTSAEVIDSTKAFLKTHPYVDPGRVGAMGASYGGFLTQYLATQTDVFSAFISHAGISALSSYWGVGDWGYTYSGVATANSFPWNRKDIYVERSPLFMADKINTPLLLLHGEKDNNVPPGESYQMYAALKLLGKEVALITIDGQAHWILDYPKRIRWMKTIIAWFDKWLKKDSFYWDSLYGKYEK